MRKHESRLWGGLLPYLTLKCAEAQSFHGYELIGLMRKRFGVYFGPSTIYPLLSLLEEQGLLTSQWNVTKTKRPCKVFTITEDGRDAAIALASTIQIVSRFEGQIPQAPQKLERHIITLQ